MVGEAERGRMVFIAQFIPGPEDLSQSFRGDGDPDGGEGGIVEDNLGCDVVGIGVRIEGGAETGERRYAKNENHNGPYEQIPVYNPLSFHNLLFTRQHEKSSFWH